MHQLTLTDAELRDLALLAYLGNRVANGRVAEGHDKPYPELHEALQKVYGLAYDADSKDLRISQDSKGELSCLQHDSPGLDLEAQRTQDIMEDYDEQAAFEIVAEELANRDDHDYVHTPAGQKATDQQLRELNHIAYHRYMDEFEQHGFERLVVNRRRKPLPCETGEQTTADSDKPRNKKKH